MKTMNFLKFAILSAFASLLLVGCNESKHKDLNDPLSSIYQTQWEGSLESKGISKGVKLAFRSETWGECHLITSDNHLTSSFEYTRDGKILYIGNIHNFGDLTETWWIYKLTPTEMILKSEPLTNTGSILTLNRIY